MEDESRWETFDDFRKKSFAICEVNFPSTANSETWLKGKCDCRNFYKLFICEHVVGIALRMKWTTPPPEAKNLPLGEKRKRGRPAKAKRALIQQD